MSSQAETMEQDCPECEKPMALRFRGTLVDGPGARIVPHEFWFHCEDHGDFAPASPAVTHTEQNA